MFWIELIPGLASHPRIQRHTSHVQQKVRFSECLGARTLLVAPDLPASNKKLLVAPGIATRSKTLLVG